MRPYECQNCRQMVYFENTQCYGCGARLGFLDEALVLCALEPAGGDLWRPHSHPQQLYRFCENAQHHACNWMVRDGADTPWCRACQLNETVPDLSNPEYVRLWQKLEVGKHRLVYSLIRLGLPAVSKDIDETDGLAFAFMADPDHVRFREADRVFTGHANGLITINIAEADDVQREKARKSMAEPYRTLLGHFRHEVGHYYWERLLYPSDMLQSCREMFGDETVDYSESLEKHYANPRPDWRDQFVSSYASCHAWEDWAETWAHYMHIIDTMETAYAYGLQLNPRFISGSRFAVGADFDPYEDNEFGKLMDAWFPITYAVNSLNRSMGQPDLYPFVLPPKVLEKLAFVHRVVHSV